MTREDLHKQFRALFPEGSTPNVYYQPPETIKLTYPCIIYNKSKKYAIHADNDKYLRYTSYDVMVISKDPDDPLVESVWDLNHCKHDRCYVSDNLHHDAFTITI